MKRGRPSHPDVLTPREWQVLELLRRGLTNDQIALELNITRAGAKYHVSEILSKLGLKSRREAAYWQPRHRLPLLVPLLARLSPGNVFAGAVFVVVAAGLTLLAIGVLRQERSAGELARAVGAERDEELEEQMLPPGATCPVTVPNASEPPGYHGLTSTDKVLGNGSLWVGLYYPDGVIFEDGGPGVIAPNGSLGMKFWWWRLNPADKLTIEGRRIDAYAPPLVASVPEGYEGQHFQATSLVFSAPGCWEVTGRASGQTLTFVTLVDRR